MDEQIQDYFLGRLNGFERTDLLKKMESNPDLKKEFIRFQNIAGLSLLSKQAKSEIEGENKYSQFFQRMKSRKQRLLLLNVFRYAAIAALLIASTVVVTMKMTKKELPRIAMNSLYVPAGQRARLSLQDGTEVWLNAKSTLTYPSYFAGNERRVQVSGEAFFSVAKDAKKPFIVSTQSMELKVLGTKFNVFSYPNADFLRTSLLEGSVEVKTNNSKIVLKPNEQATLRDGKMKIEKISFQDYFLWRDGLYCFENEKLINIIKKLELYYDVTIIVKDPKMFDVAYTGKFRQRDGVEEVLKIIGKIHQFHVTKDTENNIITLNK